MQAAAKSCPALAGGYDDGMDDPPQWTGDLDDDCTAKWRGLMLRAEWMQADVWWWCVYDESGEQVASSNMPSAEPCNSGASARRAAAAIIGV